MDGVWPGALLNQNYHKIEEFARGGGRVCQHIPMESNNCRAKKEDRKAFQWIDNETLTREKCEEKKFVSHRKKKWIKFQWILMKSSIKMDKKMAMIRIQTQFFRSFFSYWYKQKKS